MPHYNQDIDDEDEKDTKINRCDIIHIPNSPTININSCNSIGNSPCSAAYHEFNDDRENLLQNMHTSCQYPADACKKLMTSKRDPLISELRSIQDLMKKLNQRNRIEDEWIFLAKILDRLCFVVFLTAYALASVVMLLPAYIRVHDIIH